jgi:hypothetical protein
MSAAISEKELIRQRDDFEYIMGNNEQDSKFEKLDDRELGQLANNLEIQSFRARFVLWQRKQLKHLAN